MVLRKMSILTIQPLNTNEFYNAVNLEYNLDDLNMTKLNNFKFNPFCLNDKNNIRSDNDIDHDNNYLLKQIPNDKCQYYIEESFNNLMHKENISNELSLLHLNVRSIKNKYDELCDYLKSLKIDFSIIGLTETWLTDNYANIFDIPGYKFIMANRKNKNGGGVGMYITEKVDFKLREDLSVFKENILESLFVEFKTVKDTVVVGILYRPPNSRLK